MKSAAGIPFTRTLAWLTAVSPLVCVARSFTTCVPGVSNAHKAGDPVKSAKSSLPSKSQSMSVIAPWLACDVDVKDTVSPTSGTGGAKVKDDVGPASDRTTMLCVAVPLAPFESVAVTVTV